MSDLDYHIKTILEETIMGIPFSHITPEEAKRNQELNNTKEFYVYTDVLYSYSNKYLVYADNEIQAADKWEEEGGKLIEKSQSTVQEEEVAWVERNTNGANPLFYK